MGLDAVPALVDILGDRRFTRTVGFWRDFTFSHYVLRYGDAAEAILCRIAGRRFYVRRSTSGSMSRDEQTEAVRQQVQDWYETVRETGLAPVWAEAVRAGGRDSAEQASRLREADPEMFFEAVQEGIDNAADDWVRRGLVRELARLQTEQATEVLRSLAEDSGPIVIRMAALGALTDRDDPEAGRLEVVVWEALADATIRDWWGVDDDVRRLAWLTHQADDPAAAEAMASTYWQLPNTGRLAVINGLGYGAFGMHRDEDPPIHPEVDAVVEALLIMVTYGDTTLNRMSGSRNGVSYSNPRNCDLAGDVLQRLWPDRYTFDLGGMLNQRDRQRILCVNAWREARGMELLPVPELPSVERVLDEQTAPLIDRILGSEDQDDRNAARQTLFELGLGALPAVQERWESMEEDAEGRSELAEVATRLAMIVRDVNITVEAGEMPNVMREALNALCGQLLSSDVVVELLL